MTHCELAAVVLIGSAFQRKATRRQVGGRDRNDVDRAMHRARTVNDARRSAQHFDRARLLAVDLEQFVDVAEARGPDRNAVLEKQKHAAGTGAAQHGRADRGQAFLAAVALDHGAGRAIDDFAVMGRTDERDIAAAHQRDAARVIAQLFGSPRRGDDYFVDLIGGRDAHRHRPHQKGERQRAGFF